MRPVIGITASEIEPELPWQPVKHGQNLAYAEAVLAAGGMPMILPLLPNLELAGELADRLDGLLLAGGCDIAPSRYGAMPTPHLGLVSEVRDAYEFGLLDAIDAVGKPVLGICRGLQLLNVSRGGTLHQDLKSERPGTVNHGDGTYGREFVEEKLRHVLRLEPSSALAGMVGKDDLPTNSYHHQGVQLLGGTLIATAWTADGLIEAFEEPGDRFVVGVQCHPEDLADHVERRWRGLFDAFVAATRSLAER